MTEAGEEDSVAALVRTKDAPASLPQVVHFNAANAAISVGRAETNQIIINDKKISKVHAKLTLRTCKRKGASDAEAMKRLFVKDSSTFGTFINGKAIPKEQWQILQEGDVLGLRNPHGNASLGEYRVQYNEGEAGGVAPTPTAASPAATTRRAKPGPTQPLGQVAPGSPLSEDGDQVEALSPLSEVSDAPPPGAAPVPAPAAHPLLHGTMPGLIPGLSGLLPGMVPGLPPGLPPGLAPGMNMHGPCGIRLPFPGVLPVPGLPFGVPLLHGAPGLQHLLPQGMVPTGPVPNAALPGSTAKAGGPLLAGQVPPGAVATAPVTMTVQAEFIGMLIGRGGEVVKQFSKDSGARIEISKTPGEKETGERSIFLSGTHEAIEKAKKMIEDTINKAKETRGGPTAPNACTLKVPHDVIGMLIGRGGETIKELKKESGAKIDISKENPEDTDRIVSISGPPECVEHAKKMIDDMLAKSRDRYSSITVRDMEVSKDALVTPTSTALVKPADKVTVLIPTELIGMLIGKGGETIRTIQKECGVQMEIMKEDGSNDSKRAVQVTGPTEGCTRARMQIEEVLGRAREVPADPRKERESRKDSFYTFDLAAELVGRLIGRGGDTISRIQRETGAKVDVAREARDGEHAITVKGDPEAVEKARELIDDVLGQRKKNRRRDRERARDDDNDEDERPRSPVKESWISEKIYIDEVDMPARPNVLLEHEDGLPTDLEIFVKGLPQACAERDLWEHLYRLGASDVKEILLLRRHKQSKGMAYVVFNRHDHALIAKQKLHGSAASLIPCGGQPQPEEKGALQVRFSESERCINGRNNAYGTDMASLLLGSRGKHMTQVKEASGLRKVLLSGKGIKSFGQVNEDPRIHLVVYYEADEADKVDRAIEVWQDQIADLHTDLAEKASKARSAYSKGDGKGWPEFPWPPPPHHPGLPPPGMRPPFDYGPPPGYGPLPPPFDPRGPPPPFDYRPPPPYGRPPPPGWPPFDLPPPHFDRRPPFDGPRPPAGERPPFEPGRPPFEPPGFKPPFESPPGDWQGRRPPLGPPPGLPPEGAEVGSTVEAWIIQRSLWCPVKVLAKNEGNTYDIEFDGETEKNVPAIRLRPVFMGVPPPEGEGEGHHRRRRRRHTHTTENPENGTANPEEAGEGGERRHRRRRHRKGEGEPAAEEPGGAQAAPAAPAAQAAPEDEKGGGGAEGEQKQHRRRRRHHGEGEEGEGRKRRRGERTEGNSAGQQQNE